MGVRTPENTPTTDRPAVTGPELAGSPAGPDSWVAQAIAEQEEYVKRWRSCAGIDGSHADAVGLPHSWDTYSTAPGGPKYQACWRCRVTRTREDYEVKVGA